MKETRKEERGAVEPAKEDPGVEQQRQTGKAKQKTVLIKKQNNEIVQSGAKSGKQRSQSSEGKRMTTKNEVRRQVQIFWVNFERGGGTKQTLGGENKTKSRPKMKIKKGGLEASNPCGAIL